jgi:anti-sigma-K factor RskA
MTHDTEQLLGAYSLGALDPFEREQLEAHLETCRTCQSQLREYQAVATGLLHLPPKSSPARTVRANLGRAISPGRPRAERFRISRVAIGAGILALLVANSFLFVEIRELGERDRQLQRQQQIGQTAVAIGSYPDSKIVYVEADTARGTFVYERELPLAVLYVWGLERLDADHSYQAWLIQPDGRRVSGGLLELPREGYFASMLVHAPGPMADYSGFGITIEPRGGSDNPTGQRVFEGDLQ